jgi:hypothetical protein
MQQNSALQEKIIRKKIGRNVCVMKGIGRGKFIRLCRKNAAKPLVAGTLYFQLTDGSPSPGFLPGWSAGD